MRAPARLPVLVAASAPFAPKIEHRATDSLQPFTRNARKHTTKQIALIGASIRTFGFVNPILLDDNGTVIAGHGRLAAAKSLRMEKVPTIRLGHLTPAEVRAYRLADNRLAELAGWDDELLALELADLSALDLTFDLEITGFDGDFLDRMTGEAKPDPKADRIPEAMGPAVSRLGDVWAMGRHRLVCGDARDRGAYGALMGGELARVVFTDPPYNVAIDGNVGGKGKIARRDFVMGSGEMSEEAFVTFLAQSLAPAAAASLDGAIHYVCMDWRHLAELLAAGKATYAELENLIVWAKTNAGMGAFYRSQHELILAFKNGLAAHTNTFGLGETGRYRTNIWSYPGVSSFGRSRDAELAMHPTVKPVALVADAIRDVSRRGEIVLDPFGGSGTTLIAAQKTGRVARLIELDPLYADVICRRWRTFSGEAAVLEVSGKTFDAIAGGQRDV